MIILNPGRLNNGQFIAHLHICIPHSHGKVEFYKSEICASQEQTLELEQRWLSLWIRQTIRRFVNQRENALQVAGYLPMNQRAFHVIIRQILPHTNYKALCQAIDQHQDALRQILPGPDSPQSSWCRIIDEIIYNAYAYIHQ